MTTQETDGIPKPLAGYQLGLLSRALYVWQELFWNLPEGKGTEESVPLVVEQLGQSLVALADEINPGVLQELRRELGEVTALHEGMAAVWKTTEADHEIPFGWGPVPGEQHRKNLRSLADRALSRTSDLADWYRLGVALGQYQARIGRVDDAALECQSYRRLRVLPERCPQQRGD